MSNTDPTKYLSGTPVLPKGKQFLPLIRHPSYCSYIQSSPVKVLVVIEERKNIHKKDPLSFEIWIFRNGQPDRDGNRIIYVTMTSNYEQRSLA